MGKAAVTMALAALLATGCTAQPSAPSPSPSPPAPQTSPAGGCDGGGRLKPGSHELTSGGLKRRYLLSLPDGDGPHPVLLDLHGLGSSAAQQAAYSRLPEAGSRRGYIVATPQAAEGRMGWTLPHTGGPDDTAFLAALLDRLRGRLCVAVGREFAAGMSYGAGMAAALICALPGRLAGVAAVAGLSIAQPCPQAPPTTIIAFHGTADRIVPYGGGHPFKDATGSLKNLADLVVLPPVEEVMNGWAHVLGCARPATTRLDQRVRLRVWKSCPRGATLRLYTVGGGGHTWPGPIQVSRLGDTATGLDATELILDTFDRAPSR